MSKLTFDDLRRMLPELDELRPVLDHVLAQSEPDASRTWSGSGRIGTIGSRIVAPPRSPDTPRQLAAEESAHLEAVYEAVSRSIVAAAEADPVAAAAALLDAAALEEGRDRSDRAEAYALAAHDAVRDHEPKTRGLALRRAARAARTAGRWDDARARYVQAYEIAVAVADDRGAAEAAIGAGNVFEDQARWDEAERWYRTALESIGDAAEPLPERWHALINLHIVARSTGRLVASRTLLEQAEEAARAAEDGPGAAPFLENARGQLLMAEGRHDEAREHFERALAAAASARATVTIRSNLAEALHASGRTLDAVEEARLAEQEALRARLIQKLPEVYRLLGRIASEAEDPSAFVLFERALELVRERALPAVEEALTLQAYSEAEAARGETQAAAELRESALGRFEELGITNMRQRWADVFGPTQDPSDPSRDHGTNDD